MKKLLGLFLTGMMLVSLQACAQEKWIEGQNYKVLSNQQVTDTPEVTEFFSFWCPHCYAFEPYAAEIQKKLPGNVRFHKIHVDFMGFTSKQVQDEATQAMMVGRLLKKEAQMNKAIFDYIHKQHATISSTKDLKNIFIINGVDGKTFDKEINSFSVKSMVLENAKMLNKYRGNVSGVPTFIVNGKYKAIYSRDMTPDDFVNLVIWLTGLK